ncbi:pantetheinase [Dermatophagoides farinae]|uniref:pantetheinase n=1 Tax=Dermatophagoides farinae TaxID=6954 RepID=UPI003F6193CE
MMQPLRCWLLLSLMTFIVIETKKAPEGCFRAAVLDHVHQTNVRQLSDFAKIIELNFKVYEDAAALAKKQGADIIVFPEDGLIYNIASREKADEFASDIPDGETNACTLETKSVYNRLACLAQKHEIFVVADLIDRKSCEELGISNTSDSCPADKKFLFNTAVLFDRQGKLLGRYHKMHLFGEMTMNIPPKPELLVIDTELGRLGMQICFDMIFKTPGHFLAEQNKFDTMLFPTWWFDEAPMLSSSQYQMAWAFGNNVTLLASNIHRVELGSRGSGIYVGPHQTLATALYDDSVERLVLANVPIKPRETDKSVCPLDSEIIEVPQQIPIPNSVKYHHLNMNLLDVTLVELSSKDSEFHICYKGVCCQIEYRLAVKDQPRESWVDRVPLLANMLEYFTPEERYYLMVANRTRPGTYRWTEEICAVVVCPSSRWNIGKVEKDCSQFGSNQELNSRFVYAKLRGAFSESTAVYPSAVGPKNQLINPENKWKYWKVNVPDKPEHFVELGAKDNPESKAIELSTLALYGRNYDLDPTYKQKPVPINL